MAAPADFTTTWGNTSVAEDVSQIIYQITPEDTPFFNSIGETQARSTFHEWQIRSLTTRSHNAQFQGFTYGFSANNRRATRLTNSTQIIAKEVRVSETLQASDLHAIADMFADQMQIAFTEAKTDAEHAYIRGTLSSGTTNAAPQMQGFNLYMVNNSSATFTNVSGAVTITEDILNELLQLGWDAGGKPADVLVNGPMKRVLSSFISGTTKFIAAEDQRQVNTISHYESDFFPINIALSRDVLKNGSNAAVTGHDLMLYDRSMLSKAQLRPWTSRRTPEIADSMDGVVKTETTLEVGNPDAHVYAAQYLTGTSD